VEPGSELWATVAPQLAGKRLNSAGTEALVARWESAARVWQLTPDGDADSGDALPDSSLAAPPRPTPATTAVRRPFRLHRVRGAR
jgi:hypothetical protein